MKTNTFSKTLNNVIVFLLLVNSGAYFFWGKSLFFILNASFVLFAFYKFEVSFFRRNLKYILIFSFLFFWNAFKTNQSILVSLNFMLLPLFLSIDIKVREKIFSIFINKLLPVLLLISILAYFSVAFNIISLPSFIVNHSDPLRGYDYTSYIFFLTPNIGTPIFSRFYSFFDEPGVVGTLAAIIVFFRSEQMNGKVLIIYLVSGILSLSLFFFIILIYMIIIGKFKMYLKNKKQLLMLFIIILVTFSLFPYEVLQNRVFDRFEIKDGKLAGDNRISKDFMIYFWEDFIYTQDLYFGTDNIYENPSGSSIFREIYVKGLIIIILIITSYIHFFFMYKKNKLDFLANSFLFLFLIYQRPYMFNILYFLMFTTLVESSYYSYRTMCSRKLNSKYISNK